MKNPLATDLDHILEYTQGLWEDLRGKRLFLTGGTGFFGCWLLESFIWANDHLRLGAEALVLTRDIGEFRKRTPFLASHPAIQFHAGDVRSFEFPQGAYSHIIHAATTPSVKLNDEHPLEMCETIVEGTRRTLEFARRCEAKKFLFISSGLVYGQQPAQIARLPEEYGGAPNPVDHTSAYGEGKRLAELLCCLYARTYGLEAKIARCFAFMGPYQPLDAHFAIGNFIRDGINGGPIQIKGDGTPYRSYLYAADLAVWLWQIFLRGASCRAYNVGSEWELTITELAHKVAETFEPRPVVRIAKEPLLGQLPERYVPSTQRARSELQLRQTVDLRQSIKKSIEWHQQYVLTGCRT